MNLGNGPNPHPVNGHHSHLGNGPNSLGNGAFPIQSFGGGYRNATIAPNAVTPAPYYPNGAPSAVGNFNSYSSQYGGTGMGGGIRPPRNKFNNNNNSSPTSDVPQTSDTNLYIRGLKPDATDEYLRDLCQEFGKINSTKAIMDKETQTCKGFGFVDFDSREAARSAVEGLLSKNIDAQMAKARTNMQVEDPTNLYIANIPTFYDEERLKALLEQFCPQGLISARVLVDENKESRGVAFARYDSRRKCEEIINKLNGIVLPGSPEGTVPLHVKFADVKKKMQGVRGIVGAQGGMGMMYPGLDYTQQQYGGDVYSRGNGSAGHPYLLGNNFFQPAFPQYHGMDSIAALSSQISGLQLNPGANGAPNGVVSPDMVPQSGNGPVAAMHPAMNFYVYQNPNNATYYDPQSYGTNPHYNHAGANHEMHEPIGNFVLPHPNGHGQGK